jgi:P4 family phage/plasmid primase-like protien
MNHKENKAGNTPTFTLYRSNTFQDLCNVSYPIRCDISSSDDLREAVQYDHVAAAYSSGVNKKGEQIPCYRGNERFVCSDCLMLDCDNSESDDPDAWKTPEDVAKIFAGVPFYAVQSKNHMRIKDGKSARPKHHYYFPIDTVYDFKEYAALKRKMTFLFPHFDANATDAARVFVGVENPVIEEYQGKQLLTEFLKGQPDPPPEVKTKITQPTAAGKNKKLSGRVIRNHTRNSTLSSFAFQMLMKYGETEQAAQAFMERAKQCEELLDDKELNVIWNSAVKGYHDKVVPDPNYMPPEEYKVQQEVQKEQLKPSDYTDVGEARVLSAIYGSQIAYCKATDWLYFDGTVWRESETRVRSLMHDLTDQQLQQAREMVRSAQDKVSLAIESEDNAAKRSAAEEQKQAEAYRSFVLGRRKASAITSTLSETRPLVEIDASELDSDGFKMNTPAGMVDLKQGTLLPHDPKDFCTKITAVSPSLDGTDIFQEFLQQITGGDEGLESYLQLLAGMMAVGKVFCENLIVVYGTGGNGKSTLFNLLSMVLGDYAGSLPSEVLTVNCRQNKSPEYAELRGKRLVIAAELEEGMRLDTAALKKLCSTDRITAAKKFKNPFSFTPSHTTILYTNHLPKVGASDSGTWSRIVVVPFTSKIRGTKGEVKNYADFLFSRCGGAVLTWVIAGAKKIISQDFKIEQPECVRAAIEKYRGENDWLRNFVSDKCQTDRAYSCGAGELYGIYRTYCEQIGDYTRSAADFKAAMLAAGYENRKTKHGAVYYGVTVKPEPQQMSFTSNFKGKIM